MKRRALALTLALSGCATFRPMTAGSGDLEDYRAFRVASAEGTRLARAKKYLELHPSGTFAEEVRAVFEEEEPRYFEKAQATREGARRYLADLPDGLRSIALLSPVGALAEMFRYALGLGGDFLQNAAVVAVWGIGAALATARLFRWD